MDYVCPYVKQVYHPWYIISGSYINLLLRLALVQVPKSNSVANNSLSILVVAVEEAGI